MGYDINRRTYTVIPSATCQEPVSVEDFQAYAKLDADEDSVYLMLYIKAARRQAEEYTGKKFITQAVKCKLDYFPDTNFNNYGLRNTVYDFQTIAPRAFYWPADDYIDLAWAPIQSITSIITYDQANNPTTLSSASYYLDAAGSRICLNSGYTWGVDLRQRCAIEINTVNGYGDYPEDVPEDIRLAIMAMAKKAYDCRTPGGGCNDCLGMLEAYKDYSTRGW